MEISTTAMSFDNRKLNMIKPFFTLLVLWICKPVIAEAQPKYYVLFTNINCQHNSSIIMNLACSLTKTNASEALLNGRLILAKDISSFSVRTIVFYDRKNMPRMTVKDITVNVCDVFNFMKKSKIVALYMDNFKKYLNVVPKCPFCKNFNYTLTRYSFDLQGLPTFFPEGSFKTIHKIIYEKELVAQITVLGRLIHLNKAKPGYNTDN